MHKFEKHSFPLFSLQIRISWSGREFRSVDRSEEPSAPLFRQVKVVRYWIFADPPSVHIVLLLQRKIIFAKEINKKGGRDHSGNWRKSFWKWQDSIMRKSDDQFVYRSQVHMNTEELEEKAEGRKC